MDSAEEKIELDEPRPYQGVGNNFTISGWIPEKWLETSYGLSNSIFLDIIDINGLAFICTSVHVVLWERCVKKGVSMVKFWGKIGFDQCNIHFIKNSHGRITLKLTGQKEEYKLYIPINIKGLHFSIFTSLRGIFRHGKIGQIVEQYKKDLIDYNLALEQLEQRRKEKNCIDVEKKYEPMGFKNINDGFTFVGGLLEVIEKEKGYNRRYLLMAEDREERKLERKYRKVIVWRGPLLGGIFGRVNGLTFNIYSNDHDKHFHIIHKGRGINARISFPDFQLINYKNVGNSISSREFKRIIEYVKRPEVLKKLEEEFQRREAIEK
jgi:hypothetical protein